MKVVSIRSPYRSKGRQPVPLGIGHWIVFQSAPLTEARGDIPVFLRFLAHAGFNPLPLPKQGETPDFLDIYTPLLVSIRSPYRSKGRPVSVVFWNDPQFRVSIRSPYRSKGRLYSINMKSASDLCFNPLPLPKQGETQYPLSQPLLNKVSIRSPYRSKGRRKRNCRSTDPCPVSIRSPYRSKGRLISNTSSARIILGFNPLPLPKQGETPIRKRHPRVWLKCDVSIRSPYRSKGRLEMACLVLQNTRDVSIRSPYRSKGRRNVTVCA